jgi:hypothetical protein
MSINSLVEKIASVIDKIKPNTNILTKFLDKTIEKNQSLVISEKLDGISLLIEKTKTGWICMTRGNGSIGQNVTSNLISNIKLPNTDFPYSYIRGESNVIRYIPVQSVLLRVEENDSLDEILTSIMAIKMISG